MPYLSTSQDFLKESSLMLEAYPDTTRITTKYSYPKKPSPSRSKSSSTTQQKTKSEPEQQQQQQQPASTAPEPATLTLKTFDPTTGICLKYRTDKAAEVGRLIAGLGKLASGAPVEDVSSSAAVAPKIEPGDVEMADASPSASAPATPGVAATGAGAGGGGGVSKGGKGKKKGGKGKR